MMDALFLRSLQGYVRDTFGLSAWQDICRRAAPGVESFEPMLRYPPGTADRVAAEAAVFLGRPVQALWEDVGTYLVTNPGHEGVRRLLRFGGVSFTDFLQSLEEVPDRLRLALSDLDLPQLSVRQRDPDHFEVEWHAPLCGAAPVLAGILTAMADDYGALCLIDVAEEGEGGRKARIALRVLDCHHNVARRFDLALPQG